MSNPSKLPLNDDYSIYLNDIKLLIPEKLLKYIHPHLSESYFTKSHKINYITYFFYGFPISDDRAIIICSSNNPFSPCFL